MTVPAFIIQHTESREARMVDWGNRVRTNRRATLQDYVDAHNFTLELAASGFTGDTAAELARHSGESRSTAYRFSKAGQAVAALGGPERVGAADLTELLYALKAFNLGATVGEIQDAIRQDTVKDLANTLDVGHVGRRMSSDAAQMREAVQARLGTLGLDHLPAAERDELVYAVFLQMTDEALSSLIQAYRKGTENMGGQDADSA